MTKRTHQAGDSPTHSTSLWMVMPLGITRLAEAGALMSYAPECAELHRQAAVYVARIAVPSRPTSRCNNRLSSN